MRTLKTEQIGASTATGTRPALHRRLHRQDLPGVQRLHTALDYRSPAQFQKRHRANSRPGVGDAALGKGSATPTPNLMTQKPHGTNLHAQ